MRKLKIGNKNMIPKLGKLVMRKLKIGNEK